MKLLCCFNIHSWIPQPHMLWIFGQPITPEICRNCKKEKQMPALRTNPDGTPHVHTYVRADLRYDKKDPNTYKCSDPRCTHRMARKDLKGKIALCTGCAAEIILTHELLKLSRPTCAECGNRKGDKRKLQLVTGLKELGLD